MTWFPRARVPGCVRKASASLAGLALAVWLLLGGLAATEARDETRAFLAASFTLSSADFSRLDAGEVVSRTLTVADKREVSTLGVVRIGMTPEFYIQQLGDIAAFKKTEGILQIGTFANPPEVSDMAGLTLDDSDVRNLRSCRVGECDVQLSANAIRRFQQEVDWRRADAHEQANGLMRRILTEYAAEYLSRGTAASMEYADQATPRNMGLEFTSLAESPGTGWNLFGTLRKHLIDFPATALPGTTDRLYWSKEKVGRRSVVSVTHLSTLRLARESPADYAVASKHIYGSHYYDASLGLTVLVRDRRAATPVTYLVYLNRSRVDVFVGVLGGMTRYIVTSKARTMVADQLARLQRTLER
jgi:hypothetical protein